MDVSAHTKVGRVDNLIGAGHVQDSLGMDTSLVRKGTETSDGVVEGDVDLDGGSDKVFKLLELVQLIPRGNILVAADNHAGKQASKGLESISTNTGLCMFSQDLQ